MMARHGRHCSTTATPTAVPLANLPSGSRGVIAPSNGDPSAARHGHHHGDSLASAGRMAAMGFVPGVTLTVEANYGHGPVIVRIKGARVAVGRGQAASLYLLPEPAGAFDTTAVGVGRHGHWPPFTPADE